MIEPNNIYKENCADFMRNLSAQSVTVDVVVTSPPYNINKEYGTYRDNKERTEYLEWLHDIARLSYSVLKDEGSLFFNIGGTHSDPTLAFDTVKEFEEVGYKL